MTDEELEKKAKEYTDTVGIENFRKFYESEKSIADLIITTYKDAYRASAKKNGNAWHYPSKTELPKNSDEVIVFTNQNQVFAGFFNSIEWYSAEGLRLGCEVIAWQYLPEPPKEPD